MCNKFLLLAALAAACFAAAVASSPMASSSPQVGRASGASADRVEPQPAVVEQRCLFVCSSEEKAVCGSDGRTYANDCTLFKANCKDARIKMGHRGYCRRGDVPITADEVLKESAPLAIESPTREADAEQLDSEPLVVARRLPSRQGLAGRCDWLEEEEEECFCRPKWASRQPFRQLSGSVQRN